MSIVPAKHLHLGIVMQAFWNADVVHNIMFVYVHFFHLVWLIYTYTGERLSDENKI